MRTFVIYGRLLMPLKPSADQMVIPMRIKDVIIQRMKGGIRRAPVCELILVKTTIPMMTTAMDNPRGILMDNLISFIFVYSRWDDVCTRVL